MDNLSTCMICDQKFEEGGEVVVVYDATYKGQEDGIGIFELHDVMGSNLERSVYCEECHSKLVVYSWKLNSGEEKEMDSISLGWEIADVREQARRNGQELTHDELREVLYLTKKNHDASIGVNYEVLSIWIDFVIDERKEK